jgi:hypothetical protein
MINRSAYKTDDDKIKDLMFKLLYFKRDYFIGDNGNKINENIRKTYNNILYNWRRNYVYDEDDLNNQLGLFKKMEDLMNGGRMKFFKQSCKMKIMKIMKIKNKKKRKKTKSKKIKSFKISEDNDENSKY